MNIFAFIFLCCISIHTLCMVQPPTETVQLIHIAQQGLSSNNCEEREKALTILKDLIKHNNVFKEAIEAAIQAMRSNDIDQQIIAYEIFKVLFQKNQGFNEAMNAAYEAILSSEDTSLNPRTMEIKAYAFNIFQLLVDYDYALKEAKGVARYGKKHENKNIRAGAIKLHNHLLSKQAKL